MIFNRNNNLTSIEITHIPTYYKTMAQRFGNSDIHFNKDFDEVDADGVLVINKRNREQAKYPDFLPSWDPSDKLPPLKFEKYIDPGSRADPSFPNLFPKDGSHKIKRITPKFGSEIDGVQLSQLNDKGKTNWLYSWHKEKYYCLMNKTSQIKDLVLLLNLVNILVDYTFIQVQVLLVVIKSCTLLTEDLKR